LLMPFQRLELIEDLQKARASYFKLFAVKPSIMDGLLVQSRKRTSYFHIAISNRTRYKMFFSVLIILSF